MATVDMSVGITLKDVNDRFKLLDNKEDRLAFLRTYRDYNLPFIVNWDNLIETWQNYEEPANVLVAETYDNVEEVDAAEGIEELKGA